jgi:hypothetical protein
VSCKQYRALAAGLRRPPHVSVIFVSVVLTAIFAAILAAIFAPSFAPSLRLSLRLHARTAGRGGHDETVSVCS